MIGNKENDCKEMFRHACAFCEVADMAMEKFQHETADISWYVDPAEVNSAFACEVFLKALCSHYDIDWRGGLKKTKPKKKGHNLKALYEMLPEQIREHIQYRVLNECGGWHNSLGQNLLDLVSEDFEKSRYSYEHDFSKKKSLRTYTGFLKTFRNILRDVCCQLFYLTTWEEYQRGYDGRQ